MSEVCARLHADRLWPKKQRGEQLTLAQRSRLRMHLGAIDEAEAKAEAASTEYEEADRAEGRATLLRSWQCTLAERIIEWMEYQEVMTPFPWPGEDYVMPCNLDDLAYYETCPRGYPAGVGAFKERLYAHHRSIGLPLD